MLMGKDLEIDLHHLLTCYRSICICIGGCSENQKHFSP